MLGLTSDTTFRLFLFKVPLAAQVMLYVTGAAAICT